MTRILLFFTLMFISGQALAQVVGEREYNTVSKRYEFYNGASWKTLAFSIGLVPCAREAVMDYNPILKLYQYCNGSTWIKMVGIPTLSFCAKEAEVKFQGGRYYYCNGLVWVDISGF